MVINAKVANIRAKVLTNWTVTKFILLLPIHLWV